jgi:Antibiotic biosynthesis monooxygenase
MAGLVHIPWYATVMRQERFADAVAQAAPLVLRYGATQFAVHRSRDDRYRILQMAWFESKADWYRFWDGPEMTEFRRRNAGDYQIPVTYIWHDELAAGAIGPEVALEPEPAPEPEPQAAA